MSAWIVVCLTFLCLACAYGIYAHYRLSLAHREALFAYGRMENLLKQKLDLIPAVVAALRTYLSHERETIDSVMRARRLTVDARMAIKEQGATVKLMAELSNQHHSLNQASWDLLAMLTEYPAVSMDQKLAGLLQELRELDPLVRSSVLNFNARIAAVDTEYAAPLGALVGKLGGFSRLSACEPSAIDLAMVKWQASASNLSAPSTVRARTLAEAHEVTA
jgi:LemA protein